MENEDPEADFKNEQKQRNIDSELKKTETSTNDDTARNHDEILWEQLKEGQEIFDRNAGSIIISSLTAGLEIGFSFLLLCSVYSFFEGKVSETAIFKIMSLVYPAGFIMVILGQSILFTEQTSLLSLPVLNNKQSLWRLLKLWGLVITGNLIGGYLMALLLTWIGPELGIFKLNAVSQIATHVISFTPQVIFTSAVLAGWLMGLLSWLLSSAKDTVSRLMLIFMITSIMSFTGLHHSIVGNVEVFAGLIATSAITLNDYLSFQSMAIIGNAIGGVVFVALLKYHAFVYNID